MQKTASQKALKILCIIGIVLNVILLILSAGGSALAFIGLSDPAITAQLSGEVGTLNGQVMTGAQATAALGIAGVVMVVGLLLDIIACALGLRGANDPRKIGPFFWLLAVLVVVQVVGIVTSLFTGSPLTLSNLVSVAFNVLLFALAYSVKKQA